MCSKKMQKIKHVKKDTRERRKKGKDNKCEKTLRKDKAIASRQDRRDAES
jgi:hypothetical protein